MTETIGWIFKQHVKMASKHPSSFKSRYFTPDTLNSIARIDSGIDDEFLREINKDYDPKDHYF